MFFDIFPYVLRNFPMFSVYSSTQVSAQQLATSRERDSFRWLKLPIPIYRANVPIMTNASSSSAVDGRGTAEMSVVLPSDHSRALHDEGPEAPCTKENLFLCLFFRCGPWTLDWFRARAC